MDEVELEFFDQFFIDLFFSENIYKFFAARLKSLRLKFGLRNPREPIQNILLFFNNSLVIC